MKRICGTDSYEDQHRAQRRLCLFKWKEYGDVQGGRIPGGRGKFYKLEKYEGYSWTAHGRYPTNTPGWWGGAHPFTLLDWSIVHNGEISSYDANRRFIEMFGYKCTLQTDTEVITYIMDYLVRVQGLTLEEAASVVAAPFWSTIERKTDLEDKEKHIYLRTLFSSLLITGPFSIVLGFEGGLMALNDRLKLRSMVVGEKKTRCLSPARKRRYGRWSRMRKISGLLQAENL